MTHTRETDARRQDVCIVISMLQICLIWFMDKSQGKDVLGFDTHVSSTRKSLREG